MGNYSNRKNALRNLNNLRARIQDARDNYYVETDRFYRDLATCLNTHSYNKENAKPAMYFARLMSADQEEQHNIASCIGTCAAIAEGDEKAAKYGTAPSNGLVSEYLPNLRRVVKDKIVRYAEVDENNNVIGPVIIKTIPSYVYYML